MFDRIIDSYVTRVIPGKFSVEWKLKTPMECPACHKQKKRMILHEGEPVCVACIRRLEG